MQILEVYKEANIGFGAGYNIKTSILRSMYDCPFLSMGVKVWPIALNARIDYVPIGQLCQYSVSHWFFAVSQSFLTLCCSQLGVHNLQFICYGYNFIPIFYSLRPFWFFGCFHFFPLWCIGLGWYDYMHHCKFEHYREQWCACNFAYVSSNYRIWRGNLSFYSSWT